MSSCEYGEASFIESLNLATNEQDPMKKLELLTALKSSPLAGKRSSQRIVSCVEDLQDELIKLNQSFIKGSVKEYYDKQLSDFCSESPLPMAIIEKIATLTKLIPFLAEKGIFLNLEPIFSLSEFVQTFKVTEVTQSTQPILAELFQQLPEGLPGPSEITLQLIPLKILHAKSYTIGNAWKDLQSTTKQDVTIRQSHPSQLIQDAGKYNISQMTSLFSQESRVPIFASSRNSVKSFVFFDQILSSDYQKIAVINLSGFQEDGKDDFPNSVSIQDDDQVDKTGRTIHVQRSPVILKTDSFWVFNRSVHSEQEAISKKIETYQAESWPDHGVVSTSVLDKYVDKFRSLLTWKELVVVHSKEGVGRTGTLLVAAALKEQIEKQEITKDNFMEKIIEITLKARRARNSDRIVENYSQFQLLYEYGMSLLSP